MLFITEIFNYIVFAVFLNALCSISHFAVEDIFRSEVVSTLFYSCNYAKCLSAILTLAPVLVGCFILKKKACEKPLMNFEIVILKIFKGLSICVAFSIIIFFIIRSVYLLINADMTTPIALKTLITCVFTGIFIAYYFIDIKKLFLTKFKLVTHLFVVFMFLSLIGSILSFNKFSDMEAIKRITEDCKTYVIVDDMELFWTVENSDMENRIEDVTYIQNSRDQKKEKVSHSIDGETLTVNFKLVSSEKDRLKTRAKDRLDASWQEKKFFEISSKYKEPGTYSKTIKVK